MANLIDDTYFKGLIALAGMSQDYNSTGLDEYIAIYEEKVLKLALGENLYNLLIDNYNTETNDKWKKLVEGDTYTLQRDGKDFKIKYKGLREMLANFIYYYYKTELISQSTVTGEMIANNQNSIPAKKDTKIIKAYNFGVELYGVMKDIDQDIVTVGDFPFFVRPSILDVYKASMFNYITYQNEQDDTTYPNWIFTALTKINEFEI